MTEDSRTSEKDLVRAPDSDVLTDGDGGDELDVVREYAHSCRIVREYVEGDEDRFHYEGPMGRVKSFVIGIIRPCHCLRHTPTSTCKAE